MIVVKSVHFTIENCRLGCYLGSRNSPGNAPLTVVPGEILAITFTNKAAGEMAARVATLVGDRRARAMWVMTFHSACVRILRREAARFGYPSNFSIYDSAD